MGKSMNIDEYEEAYLKTPPLPFQINRDIERPLITVQSSDQMLADWLERSERRKKSTSAQMSLLDGDDQPQEEVDDSNPGPSYGKIICIYCRNAINNSLCTCKERLKHGDSKENPTPPATC